MAEYPTPYWSKSAKRWMVDLRSPRWGGFDRMVLDDVPRVDSPEANLKASAAAVAKMYALRERAAAESRQIALNFAGAPKFSEVVDLAWGRRQKEPLSPDNRRYIGAQFRW